jgi:uncharacterized membrane protein YbaN (DUF454 family)
VSAPESDEGTALHDSPFVRAVLIAVGALSVVLGLVGIVVPVLPTTPFLLVAAACFARASPSLYRRLVASPTFGPLIVEWRRHRSIPWRAKLTAITLLAVSLGASIVLFVRPAWLQALVALFGLGVGAWLYRIPSRDRPTPR